MRNLGLLFLIGLLTCFLPQKLVSSQSSITSADDLYIEGQSSGGLPIDDEDGDDDGSGSGSGDYGFNSIPDLEESLRKFLNVSGTFTEEMPPLQPQPTAASPHTLATTAAADQQPSVPEKDAETTPSTSSEEGEKEVPAVDPTAHSNAPHRSPAPQSTAAPPSQTVAPDFSIDISVTKHNPDDNSLDRWDVPPTKDNVLIKQVENDIESSRGSRRLDFTPPEEVKSENLWERTEVLAAVIACGVVGFLCGVFLLLLLAYRMKKKDEGSYDLGDNKLSSTAYHKAPTKEFYA